MADSTSHHSLSGVISSLQETSENKQQVSVDEVLQTIGRRSFGPLLVCIGLILAIPGVSDIPGVPTLFGSIIVLTVGQQVIGRTHIWLPSWLLKRSVKKSTLDTTLSYAAPVAEKIDRWISRRLTGLVTNRASSLLSALACLSIALATPLMEVVFFSANVAGVSLFLFGLAYLAHDGLIMLLSFLVYTGLVALILAAFM